MSGRVIGHMPQRHDCHAGEDLDFAIIGDVWQCDQCDNIWIAVGDGMSSTSVEWRLVPISQHAHIMSTLASEWLG